MQKLKVQFQRPMTNVCDFLYKISAIKYNGPLGYLLGAVEAELFPRFIGSSLYYCTQKFSSNKGVSFIDHIL